MKKRNRLIIRDISELPEGQGLEKPLHPKRIRAWKPSNLGRISPALPGTSQCPGSPVLSPSLSNPDPLSLQPPAMSHGPSPRSSLYNSNIGSDNDSEGFEDEEEAGMHPTISRVFRTMLETPLDDDEQMVEDVEPTVGDSAEQPWDLYHFDWNDFPTIPIPPESRREEFTVINAGPTISSDDPYVIFTTIWDRPIMDHMAAQTNKYAQEMASQMIQNNNLHPRSRISRWHDTTADELYVFLGMILAMGVVVKTNIAEYWDATLNIFSTPGFGAHMSIDRFILLCKCLHFNENDKMCTLNLNHSEARLFKIQPILSHLNNKFQSLYVPAQNLSLDESLLMWKGLLDISQLIPNKAAHRGIKTYELCESQTGYLWRFEVHAHKKSLVQSVDPLEAFTPSIVVQLVKGLEYKGYTLWMDNFYQSPCLARRLKCLGFDCVGTLRTDRKRVPETLNTLTKKNMRRGQITGLTSGDVDVMVWRDINRVAMISTYHGNSQQKAQGSTKPTVIMDYNIMMGGVDKKDQLLAMYPVERKRTKIWYKKLFRRLLNISTLNSYIIHTKNSLQKRSMSHRLFRLNLITSLLKTHYTQSPIFFATRQNMKASVDVSHHLAEYPKAKHQRLRRQCKVCKKLQRTFCVACNKTVCMDPCFVSLHKNLMDYV